jgi:ketosteroid isomerase-like protein
MSRIDSPSDYARDIFAAFDAKDVPALVALMTDDVRARLGNADIVEGKPAFAGVAERARAAERHAATPPDAHRHVAPH